MAEPFRLPFSSREERIAHNEAWARSLNERRAEWAGESAPISDSAAMSDFRCECWQEECAERIHLSRAEWKMVRANPSRFAVAPDHVAENFEAVVKKFPRFWVLEKFGEAGEIAEELASSD